MHVTAWALVRWKKRRSERARPAARVPHLYGPGGFATPDDVAALEAAQQGYSAWREVQWNDLSRGMTHPESQSNTDEGHPACVLAALARPDGERSVMMVAGNVELNDLRSEVEDLLYHEAELLDAWKLDDWLKLLADDATYYVPPNDKPEADHRDTLFTIADDIVRLRERVIRLKDPNCHAEFPPSRTRRFRHQCACETDLPPERSPSPPTSSFTVIAVVSRRVFLSVTTLTKLRRVGGALKFAERRAVLDAEELGALGAVSFIL